MWDFSTSAHIFDSAVYRFDGSGPGRPISLGSLDVYDLLNGSVKLAWSAFAGATSYNVYLNGVLNQSVTQPTAIVSGLSQTAYSAATVAAASGNSARPQNMPPTGVVTGPSTYVFSVTAVAGGLEVSSASRKVTVSPTSIMLRTPMKRPFPFPNTAPGG